MRTDQEILNDAADRASQILRIPHTYLDKVKFIQLFYLIHNVMGGDEELMRHFLNTHNKHLDFCPAARLTDNVSLDKVIGYLESFVDG